jgi:3-oxosteroid 1-dehydrogenase
MAFKLGRWDLEVDVIAVGSGLGGLAAAIRAHDEGKKALILEKAPRLGGVCAYSGGEVFVPANHLMGKAGISDSREAGKAYLDFLAAGYAEPALRDVLLDVGPEAIRYFGEKAGVRWKIIAGFPDYHYPKAPGTVAAGRYLEVEPFPGAELGEWKSKSYLSPHMPNGITHDELFAWGGFVNIMKWDFATLGKRVSQDIRTFGPGMMAYFIRAAVLERKIPTHVSSPVKELVVEDGEVIGVKAEINGKSQMIKAKKGVVVATGGYDWNAELARFFEDLPEWGSMCQPSLEGDGFVMGQEAGAAIGKVPSANLGLFFGYQVPGETHDGKPLVRGSWEGGFPHAIWVNARGERFADESFYRDYLPKTRQWDGVTQTQPNFPPFLIFDQNYKSKYPLGTFLPVNDIPESLVAKAATLRELAGKLGIDADGLEKSVARWNQLCETNVDADYQRGTYPWAAMMTGDRTRPNPNMGPIDKAPFYGMRMVVASVGVNAAGLRVNVNGQVLSPRGKPIPGFYAAGNATAPLDIGAGYQSGLSNLRGLVFGYLAGKHAAHR